MKVVRHTAPTTGSRPTNWSTRAACLGLYDVMFPDSDAADIADAKAICNTCPIIEPCLQWALDTGEEHGVWGGLSGKERRTLRCQAERPISIDDYTNTPRAMHASRTLDEAWAEFTEPDGEHVLWTGPQVVHQPGGNLTPNRLAFRLDRGRWPDGGVKRTCGVGGCVRPTHLMDRRERWEAAGRTKAAA